MSKNSLAFAVKAGLAGAAAVAAVLAVSVPASAGEAGVGATVTPSTGLADGATVSVAVSGFGAGQNVFVTECAGAAATLVCNVDGISQLTTDAAGAGSTTTKVAKSFQGKDQSGKPVTVDCTTVAGGCLIGASNEAQERATAAISFA
ncbi:enediyne antibiotic chromoprotein [Amycolatopsis panacis]|uniref:Neocarzinostatin n=1 Tax=Amycolatopsis panacis TaxID=2340917 RepID=A0A419HJB6_9PSEU|nr:enediyne antibiotic chromoprotein [Amycolatopsis panacis]RJQ75869.1 neocarzinostatin [Amycolatopsis panacis]